MGRKKKKPSKPWCWYCNREFEDEKILIQHQKAKHFKCHVCHKKLYTGAGLAIHCMQVHKETIDKIPNALPNRNSVDIEIYGMDGIPEADIREHEKTRGGDYAPPPPPTPPKPLGTGPAGLLGVSGIIPPSAVGLNVGSAPPMPPGPNPFSMSIPPPFPPPGMPPHPAFAAALAAAGTSYSSVPPPSSLSAPPMMAVPKPLFPAATVMNGHFSSNPGPSSISAPPSGLSGGPILSSPAVLSKPAATIASSGSATRITHPDEDISLEELRIRQQRYKHLGLNIPQPSQSGGPPTLNFPPMMSGPPPPFSGPPPGLPPPPTGNFQSTFRPSY
ncbi:BUB3-interacting and GLEBS motif-containing protein [Halotydeus destructor]|nr:BUB3-interacting and GLEBS motif-containing protein [Halotydeus destructor]